MVEKAYFTALNREIDARQFIKEFNNGNKTLLTEPCICVDLKCKAPLEIIGKRKLFEGKNVKKHGYRVTKNEQKAHHIYDCCQLGPKEAREEIIAETKEAKTAAVNGKGITITPVRSRNTSSIAQEGSKESRSTSLKSETRKKHTGNYSGNRQFQNKYLSNVGSIVELYRDPDFNDQNLINLNFPNHQDLIGANGSRTLNDLFFDMDGGKNPQENKFYIFYGKISTTAYKDTATVFKFTSLVKQHLVFVNNKLLLRLALGKHIMNSSKKSAPILYFEGYFGRDDENLFRAKNVNSNFAQSIYMRPKYD
ncbi:hypothetical protein GBO60_03625 [Pediococcus acidilactici]|uniref:hypothetical protein n=1 Tax=Pediococcus acidilactici TaxID=1254 RepID=UPI001323EAD1|nr:hypothetical protein [Pediococcus acidilactici]KAF0371950.1 hypothetical protein GBO60_03625 [Pediococcus acidilactici]KAF0390922.1 hypothetical protein GBO67_03625 [Pediococcus acidilactici]